MKNSIDIDKDNRFLGYHYGLGKVLAQPISPQPGMFFINGETNSVWVWDSLTKMWVDTNRVDSGLKGMLTDEKGNSPADFVPSQKVGVKESYFYMAEHDDVDANSDASPKTITFTHFKNGVNSVSVTVRKTSIVTLFWNGTYWEVKVVPFINLNYSVYATKKDFDDVKNSVQLRGVSSNETLNKFFKELYVVPTKEDFQIEGLYLNAIARNYEGSSSNYWGITFLRAGSSNALFANVYENPESKDVLEWNLYEGDYGTIAKMYAVVDWSAIEAGTRFTTGRNIPLKYWEDVRYSPYIGAYLENKRATIAESAIIDKISEEENNRILLQNITQQFTYSSNETLNKFFKELYVVPTKEDFQIEGLYLNAIARNYEGSSSNYWGITFLRAGSSNALFANVYENPESKDVLEWNLYEGDYGTIAKMYAVVDWSAIEDGTRFTTGRNIPLKYWEDVRYSPYIGAYIKDNSNKVGDSVKFIDSENYSTIFKELYIASFENKIYRKETDKSVNTYFEDIPSDKVNLQLMNITRKGVSQSSGKNFWNFVFHINIPKYELRDDKYYIVRDANGEVQYTQNTNFFFTLYEENNGVIDEYLTYSLILREENQELRYYTYRMRLYAVVDWSQIKEGTSVNFYPRNVLSTAYDIENSPQIKEYIKEKESYLPIRIAPATTINLMPDNKIMLYGASLCSNSYPWFKEWLERYTGTEVINAGNPGWNAKQLASTDYYNKVRDINPDVIYVMLGGNDKGDDVGTFGAISSQTLVDEIPITESWSKDEANSKEYKFIQCLDYILRKLKSEYYDVKDNPKNDKRFPYIVVGSFTSQHREGYEMIEYNNPQNWLNKRNAIVECANKNNLPCIDVFSKIGIDWDKEPYYNSDLDSSPLGGSTLVNRGIYTLDGLHLNEYGSEKIARLISAALLPSNSGVKEIELSASFNMNDYKEQGVYYVNGERTATTDNLPIQNTGYISGQITVLEANGCITQYLKLTNAGGSEGKEYIRTFANGSWSVWRELKQTANLGQLTDDALKEIVDNGYYEGVILNGYSDMNNLTTIVTGFLQTIGAGTERLVSGTYFLMQVMNNYAVTSVASSLMGVTVPRSVTQVAKIQLINDGHYDVTSYLEVQRTKIGDNAWSNWKLVNVL